MYTLLNIHRYIIIKYTILQALNFAAQRATGSPSFPSRQQLF
jgi:hypothetical protein